MDHADITRIVAKSGVAEKQHVKCADVINLVLNVTCVPQMDFVSPNKILHWNHSPFQVNEAEQNRIVVQNWIRTSKNLKSLNVGAAIKVWLPSKAVGHLVCIRTVQNIPQAAYMWHSQKLRVLEFKENVI